MSDHHHHHHHDHSGPIAIGANAKRVVIGLLAVIAVVVLGGLIWLWPSHQHIDIPLPMQNQGGGAVHTEAGTVVKQDIGACGSPSQGKTFTDQPLLPRANGYNCQRSIVSIESGPAKGSFTLLEIAPGPGQPELSAGDHIRLVRQNDPSGAPLYSFDDYSRGMPLSIIVGVFAVVVIVVARWRGLRALLGLVVAFGVLVGFLLPAMLDGKPAIPVALVAGAIILYAVLYLAHGVNLRTSSALLGTLTSMIVGAVLSWVALKMTHLTGLSEEQNTNVATYLQHVSITGLLLAGFIIGSLGVLNDVTITQASAAFELAELDKHASRRSIFAAAMRVGRDHIASTVYTLVLAYAGGALPLLLLFSVAGRSIRDVLTGDAVGIEIARSAVGGIALALSVPLTTVIAVLLARPFGSGGHDDHDHDDEYDDEDEYEEELALAGSPRGAARARGGAGYPRTDEAQQNPGRPGARRSGPRTGAQPAVRGARSGGLRGDERTGGRDPQTGGARDTQTGVARRDSHTGRSGEQPAVPRTGAQPRSQRRDAGPDSGEQLSAPWTGASVVLSHTGEHPAMPNTGSQPQVPQPGSQVLGPHTGSQPPAPHPGAQPHAPHTGSQSQVSQSGSQAPGLQPGSPQYGAQPYAPSPGAQPLLSGSQPGMPQQPGPYEPGSGEYPPAWTGSQPVSPQSGRYSTVSGSGEPPTVPRTSVVQPNPQRPDPNSARGSWFQGDPFPEQHGTGSWALDDQSWAEDDRAWTDDDDSWSAHDPSWPGNDPSWPEATGRQDPPWPPEPPRGGRHSRPE